MSAKVAQESEKKVAVGVATVKSAYLPQHQLCAMVKEELDRMHTLRVSTADGAGITRLYVDTDVESFEFTSSSRIVRDPTSGRNGIQLTIEVYRPDAPKNMVTTTMCKPSEVEAMMKLLSEQRIDAISIQRNSDLGDVDASSDGKREDLYRYVEKDCDEILPGIFIGTAAASNRFTHVINCSRRYVNEPATGLSTRVLPSSRERKTKSQLPQVTPQVSSGYQATWWSEDGSENIVGHLDELILLIKEWDQLIKSTKPSERLRVQAATGKILGILICSDQGRSRSAALMTAYLLSEYRKAFLYVESALGFVTVRRPVAKPCAALMKQLEHYNEILCQRELDELEAKAPIDNDDDDDFDDCHNERLGSGYGSEEEDERLANRDRYY